MRNRSKPPSPDAGPKYLYAAGLATDGAKGRPSMGSIPTRRRTPEYAKVIDVVRSFLGKGPDFAGASRLGTYLKFAAYRQDEFYQVVPTDTAVYYVLADRLRDDGYEVEVVETAAGCYVRSGPDVLHGTPPRTWRSTPKALMYGLPFVTLKLRRRDWAAENLPRPVTGESR